MTEDLTVNITIKTDDSEEFIDELEELCKKHAINPKSYFYTFK